MEKRDTCVNQKRVSRDEFTANPISELVKGEAIKEWKELDTLVE